MLLKIDNLSLIGFFLDSIPSVWGFFLDSLREVGVLKPIVRINLYTSNMFYGASVKVSAAHERKSHFTYLV